MRPHLDLSLLLLLLGPLTWAACSSDAPRTDGPPADGRSLGERVMVDGPHRDQLTTEGTPPDQKRKVDASPSAKVCGTLSDAEGGVVSGGTLIICNDHRCFTADSSSKGSFCVEVAEASSYLFHAVEATAGGAHLGDVLFPLSVSQAEIVGQVRVEVGQVIQPRVGQTVELDPVKGGTLDLGQGASLAVPAGVTVLPPLKTTAEVGYASLPTSKLHPKLLASRPGAPAPLAAFLLEPVGVSFSVAVPFMLPGAGLAPGANVSLYGVNDQTGVLEPQGEALVSAGGMLTSGPGSGLRALGWFVLYPP